MLGNRRDRRGYRLTTRGRQDESVSCLIGKLFQGPRGASPWRSLAKPFQSRAPGQIFSSRNLGSRRRKAGKYRSGFGNANLTDPLQFFKRAPLHAEWTRFQQRYASKVQHLKVSSPNEVISSAALHLLQLCSPHSPLLPNLVSLHWISNEEFLPFISPFISRFLMSIDIDVPRVASPMLPPILTKLSTLSSDLREIQVQRLSHSPSTEEASSQLLMQCNPYRLRKYNVDSPMSASVLGHTVQLPSLEEFWLVVVDSFQLPDPLPVIVFPSLRILDVKYNGDLTWLKLLPAIDNPSLTSIFVQCSGSDVAHFMEAFQLITTGCGMHERVQQFRVRGHDEFKITPRTIACTFSFKNLTFLKMLSECSATSCQTLHLTDNDIDLLTKAMPRLESLALGGEPCRVRSKITFKSLYAISRRCTRLTTLQIHFDPASFVVKVEMDSMDVALGLPDLKTPSSGSCPVTRIDVGYIPVPDESNACYVIGLGLLGVFPRLKKVGYNDEDWEDIDELIGVCQRMGHFAFG